MLEFAQENSDFSHSPVHFMKANALHLPFSAPIFDRIVCDLPFGAKHQANFNLERLMLEFSKLLKPGAGRTVLLMNPQQADALKALQFVLVTERFSVKLGETEACIVALNFI